MNTAASTKKATKNFLLILKYVEDALFEKFPEEITFTKFLISHDKGLFERCSETLISGHFLSNYITSNQHQQIIFLISIHCPLITYLNAQKVTQKLISPVHILSSISIILKNSKLFPSLSKSFTDRNHLLARPSMAPHSRVE